MGTRAEKLKQLLSKNAGYGDQIRHEGYNVSYPSSVRGKWSDKLNESPSSVATEKPITAPGSALSADGLTTAHTVERKDSQVGNIEDQRKFTHAGKKQAAVLAHLLAKCAVEIQAPSTGGYASPGVTRNTTAAPGSITQSAASVERPEDSAEQVPDGLMRSSGSSSSSSTPSTGEGGISHGTVPTSDKTANAIGADLLSKKRKNGKTMLRHALRKITDKDE